MATDIDVINLKINIDTSSTSEGISALDRVTKSLNDLKEISKGGANLTAVNNQLNKFNETLQKLSENTDVIDKLRGYFTEMASSGMMLAPIIENLSSQISQLYGALGLVNYKTDEANNYARSLSKITEEQNKSNNAVDKGSFSYQKFTNTLVYTQLKMQLLLKTVMTVGRKMLTYINDMSSYMENIALFNVAMGQYAEKAGEYAYKVEETLGIDPSSWMRSQAIIANMSTGFGIGSENAYKMSDAMTKLSYDMSAFFNVDQQSTMSAIQSGLNGQKIALQRYGFAIGEASIQQQAYKQGIRESVSELSEGVKAQLRYNAIIEQANKMGIMGALSREITTPANALRILSQQFTMLGRTIASVFIPILTTVIPYLIAFAQVLGNVISLLATWLGFNLPKIEGSWSGLSNTFKDVGTNVGGIGDNAGKSTNKVKKLKEELKGLASFDELHVLTPDREQDMPSSSGSVGGGAGGGGLGLTTPDLDLGEYGDFLGDVQNKVNELIPSMEKLLSIIGLVGATLGTFVIASKVAGFISGLANAMGLFGDNAELSAIKSRNFSSGLTLVIAGLVALASAFTISLFQWNELSTLGKIGVVVLGMVGGAMVAVGVSALAMGTSIATAISVATLGIGAVIGLVVTLVGAIGNMIMRNNEASASVRDLDSANAKLEETLTTLTNAQTNNISAIEGYEKAIKELNQAQNETGLSGEELYKSVQSGVLTFENMTEEQRKVYKSYINVQGATDNLKASNEELAVAIKETTLAELDHGVALAHSTGDYKTYKTAVMDAFNSGKISAEEAQDALNKAMSNMSYDTAETFKEDIPEYIKSGLDSTAYSDTWSKFTMSFDVFTSGISEGWNSFWGGTSEAVSSGLETARSFAESSISGITSKIGELGGNIGTTFENVKVDVGNKWEEVKQGFGDKIEEMESGFGTFTDNLSLGWENIKSNAGNKWEEVKEGFGTKIEEMKSGFGIFKEDLSTGWSNIQLGASTKWEEVKEGFGTKVEEMKNKLGGFVPSVAENFEKVRNSVETIWGKVTGWLFTTWDKTWNNITGLFSRGGEIFKGFTDGFSKVFKEVVNNIIQGINTVISKPIEFINGILNSIRATNIMGFEPFAGLWGYNPIVFHKIPRYEKGTNYVPETGIALLHEGETVIPREQGKEFKMEKNHFNEESLSVLKDLLSVAIEIYEKDNTVVVEKEDTVALQQRRLKTIGG